MRRLRILLADDHALVRHGLRKILEECPDWEVVAEVGNGRDAVGQAVKLKPDLAILDIGMPVLNGVEAARQITRRQPAVRVLMLSMYSQEGFVTQALKAGARGYLLKDSVGTDLSRAVTALVEGKSFFSPAVAKIMLDEYVRGLADRGITDRYESLTEREREVFQLIVEGRGNKEIATVLGISPGTVDTHRGRIMEKLDVHSAVEMVLYAVRRGIIT